MGKTREVERHAMSYRVALDAYNGPLDLLLYLIRKEEVEITDIPVARIADQYAAYLDMLEALDINVAGEFLVMAATLLEIKSRMVLPRPESVDEEDQEGDEEDPRLELVQQLLEYKRFKEAAQDLETLGEDQARRYSRPPAQVIVGPEDQQFVIDEMMKDVNLWDLLNAFANVMDSINIAPGEVIYDDTPIEDVSQQMLDIVKQRGTMRFSSLFLQLFEGQEPVGRSHLISAFLAILECIRRRLIAVQQETDASDLRIFWYEEKPDEASGRPAPPDEVNADSGEAARKTEQIPPPPAGRFVETEGIEELQATEFDKDLDAITVPDVERFHPIYSDDEILGRQAEDEDHSDEQPESDGRTEEAEQPDADESSDAPDPENPPHRS